MQALPAGVLGRRPSPVAQSRRDGDGVTYRVCVLPGDGIGPEDGRPRRDVLDAAADALRLLVETRRAPLRRRGDRRRRRPFPGETREACLASDAVLFGAVGGPRWDNGAVRPEQGISPARALGVYANLRPIRRYGGACTSRRCGPSSSRASTS